MPFDVARVSRSGGYRINEDCADSLELGTNVCAVVADGGPGNGGGDVASRAVVLATLESFREAREATAGNLTGHVRRAHEAVLSRQREEPALAQVRSTIALLVAGADHAAWAHVGDTRIYWLHAGKLVARTKDHTARRALGSEEEAGATTSTAQPLQQGDAFLLCTDGFWESLTDVEIAIDYCGSSSAEGWLERLETRIAQRITPDNDNYSAIAVRVVDHDRIV